MRNPANATIKALNRAMASLPREERTRIVGALGPIVDLAFDEMERDARRIKADLDDLERRIASA